MSARTVFLIKKLEAKVTAEMTITLNEFDVTPLQYSVLSFVENKGHLFSSAQLARSFVMTPQSMNEVVAILIRKDMLEKATDPNHKRVQRLNLTVKGKTILEQCNAAIDAMEQNLLRGLDNTEIKVFRSLLNRILDEARALNR